MGSQSCELGEGFCMEVNSPPVVMVIFGASGDLTQRKLIPALFYLFKNNLLHDQSRIVGCARSSLSTKQFRDKMSDALDEFIEVSNGETSKELFLDKLSYVHGGYDSEETYKALREHIAALHPNSNVDLDHVYYLSTPASLYQVIVKQLGNAGLVDQSQGGKRRVVIEKPFGFDLDSAAELDQELRTVLTEEQTYRIDHYLGKETVQNILMLRFANMIFEPVWNNRYIDSVQITVAESIGVGHRAGFYETAGLLRDMFQNHMFQVLGLVAMEAPYSFEADSIRNEKVKLLKSIRPWSPHSIDEFFVRGQYISAGDNIGYRNESGVNTQSATETFVASKLYIDNWRWKGVPFYLRSGKRLPKRMSEIVITFKQIPHSIFGPIKEEALEPNRLVLNIQPEEGISLSFNAKHPGPKLCMGSLKMDFKYADIFGGETGDAYARLLLDSMLGDQTLFIRSDFIQAAWGLLSPVLDYWNKQGTKGLEFYESGSWGPQKAEELLQKDGFCWKNT